MSAFLSTKIKRLYDGAPEALRRKVRPFIAGTRHGRNRFLSFLGSHLGDRGAFHLFQSLGVRFRVDEIASRGEFGRVRGQLADQHIFSQYVWQGNYAPSYARFLRRCFSRAGGGTFLDIGANIGLTAIPVAQLGTAFCYCFEPEPRNGDLLRLNLAENCPEGSYRVIPIALHRSEGFVEFELAHHNFGDHRIRSCDAVSEGAGAADRYAESERTVISVPARRLDDVLEPRREGEFVAIKCDAQGAELGIYEGGRKTFQRSDLLLMEFWPYGLRRMGGKPEELVDLLQHDYSHAMVVSAREEIDLSELLAMDAIADRLRSFAAHPPDGVGHTDVLAIKDHARRRLLAPPG